MTVIKPDHGLVGRERRITVILLLAAAILSIIFAEQIITGWIALGQRLNISRRDLNLLELTTIVVTGLWGLVALIAAVRFLPVIGDLIYVPDYLGNRKQSDQEQTGVVRGLPIGVVLSIVLLALCGLLSLLASEQILTGWLALGERANISRRDINAREWIAIGVTAFWGITNLVMMWGLIKRNPLIWSWSMWIVLLNALLGLIIVVSGIFDVGDAIPRDETVLRNLPELQRFITPGLILLFSSLAAYRYLGVGTDLRPDQALRNELAKTPGAGAIVGFIAIFIFFSVTADLFLTDRSIASFLSSNVGRGIIAIGVTILMISGEFDLSIGSIFGASALVFLQLLTDGLFGLPPFDPLLAMVGGLLFAALLGLINGLVMIWTGIPSFIVTLGTLLAYRAILLVLIPQGRILRYHDTHAFDDLPFLSIPRLLIVGGLIVMALLVVIVARSLSINGWRTLRNRIRHNPKWGDIDNPKLDVNATDDFRWFWVVVHSVRLVVTLAAVIGFVVGSAIIIKNQLDAYSTSSLLVIDFFEVANGRFRFVPNDVNLRVGVMWWFLLVIIFQFVLTQTRFGNSVFAVGGNPGAALAQGVNVTRVKVINFMLIAVLAGIAGIASAARVKSIGPDLGTGLELEVIAASVIGGALLSGGYGSVFGAFLGVMIFGSLQTGLVLIGLNARLFDGVIGVIIIVAVVINTAARRQRS